MILVVEKNRARREKEHNYFDLQKNGSKDNIDFVGVLRILFVLP